MKRLLNLTDPRSQLWEVPMPFREESVGWWMNGGCWAQATR